MRQTYNVLKNAKQEHGVAVALRLAIGLALSRDFVFALLKRAVSSAWVLISAVLSVCWGIAAFQFLDRAADHVLFRYGGFVLSRDVFLLYGLVFPVAVFLWAVRASDKMARRPKTESSGAHGTADIATPAMIAAAGLTGRKRGEGFRLCEDGDGNVIRYCGKKDGNPQPNSIAIIGPPRCGKLATLAAALTVENQGSMVIIDPRAEILCITLRTRKALGPVKVICPIREGLPKGVLDVIERHFQEQGSHPQTDSYNVLDQLNPASQVFETECNRIAKILVKDDPSGKDKYFSGNAQKAVSGVIMELKTNWPDDEANLARVCEIVSTDEIFAFSRAAVKIAKQTGNKYIAARLSRFARENPETDEQVMNFLSLAAEQLNFMSSRAMESVLRTPEKPWRFHDLKSGERPMTVYIVNPVGYAEEMAQFNRLLITTICKEILGDQKGKQHTTILADEFPTLGYVPELEPIFTMGGGSGVSLIPIAQTVSQMTKIWGQEGWRTMQSGLDLTLYFPPKNDEQTINELVRLGGQRTIVTQSYNYDAKEGSLSGISRSEMGKPVFGPHDVSSMSGRCFISAPGMPELRGDLIVGHMRAYWDYKDKGDIAELCDDNPWHKLE
jgi:type IV secretory pathway TraG/TraD family ATPase VirD4